MSLHRIHCALISTYGASVLACGDCVLTKGDHMLSIDPFLPIALSWDSPVPSGGDHKLLLILSGQF